MSSPSLTYITVTDGTTNFNAAFFTTLQNNIVAYVSQFLPLSGGTMTGNVTWATTQTFPSSQVIIPNPSYTHTGFYNTLDDHINDPIHGAPVYPLAHASSHEIGGADILYGTLIQVAPDVNQSITSYFDALVVAASGNVYPGPPASSRYEIGGADPLYGNLIAIDASHPTLDIETFVNNTVLAAIVTGSGNANPTYNSVTLSGGILDTSNSVNLSIRSLGIPLFTSVANAATNIFSAGANAQINFGVSGGTGIEYGSVSSAGYSAGASTYGPTSATINGPLEADYDITVTRSAGSVGFANTNNTGGLINFGKNTGSYISYNIDIANALYTSVPFTFQEIDIASGHILNVGSVLYLGNTLYNTTGAGLYSVGTDIDVYAKEGGNVKLGYSNTSLSSITLGPAGAWGIFSGLGLKIGTTVLGATGSSLAGNLSINGAYTLNTGDAGIANGPAAARMYFGQSSSNAGYIDFGNISTGGFTLGTLNSATNGGILAKVLADGTYVAAGSASSYGPTTANVSGNVIAGKAISAAAGVDTGGNSGYCFGQAYGTGMFSSGIGDLRFLLNSLNILDFSGNTATFASNIAAPNNSISAQTGNFTQTLTVSGNLILNSGIQTQYTTATNFRTKGLIELGYTVGAVATGTAYKHVPIPYFTGGQIEYFRIATATTDNLSQPTIFTIYQNGVSIGSIQLGSGQTSGWTTPTVNPTPIAPGDIINAVCTQQGGATNVAIYIETSQLLY